MSFEVPQVAMVEEEGWSPEIRSIPENLHTRVYGTIPRMMDTIARAGLVWLWNATPSDQRRYLGEVCLPDEVEECLEFIADGKKRAAMGMSLEC